MIIGMYMVWLAERWDIKSVDVNYGGINVYLCSVHVCMFLFTFPSHHDHLEEKSGRGSSHNHHHDLAKVQIN